MSFQKIDKQSCRCRRGVGLSPRRDRRQLSRKIATKAPYYPPAVQPTNAVRNVSFGYPMF